MTQKLLARLTKTGTCKGKGNVCAWLCDKRVPSNEYKYLCSGTKLKIYFLIKTCFAPRTFVLINLSSQSYQVFVFFSVSVFQCFRFKRNLIQSKLNFLRNKYYIAHG